MNFKCGSNLIRSLSFKRIFKYDLKPFKLGEFPEELKYDRPYSKKMIIKKY